MPLGITGRLAWAAVAAAGLVLSGAAAAQGWKPERPVELTIPAGPGGSTDLTGRVVQRLWDSLNLLPVPSSVVNRGGGGHVIAYTYLQGRAGDPHAIAIMATPILMNVATGRSTLTYRDLTPIAILTDEPMIAAVRADSPLKTGRDLLDALRKNPAQYSIALSTDSHRVSIGLPLQKAGVEIKGTRIVAFKSGGETSTAVLGGHADVMITSVSSIVPHLASGKMRGLAVSSAKRLSGPVSPVPTWLEQGFESSGSWKGVIAPPRITPAQVAFWEEVMRRTARSEEILEYAAKNQWLIDFKGASDTVKWMAEESERLHGVVQGLGMVKRK